MTIALITGGSFTTDSLAPIGLCLATSASSAGSVTVSPWSQISPVSSSTNTAGHWLSGVSGVIPTKLSRITASSIEGVPKWVFLVEGNPGAKAWLVHAVDRQGEQPARGLVEVQSRQALARVTPDDQMRLTGQGAAAFASGPSWNHERPARGPAARATLGLGKAAVVVHSEIQPQRMRRRGDESPSRRLLLAVGQPGQDLAGDRGIDGV